MTSGTAIQRSRARRLVTAAALALATLAVFWPVTGSQYTNFDDNLYVFANPWVKKGISTEGVIRAFSLSGYAANWHPLTWISHQIDAAIFGPGPKGPHVGNLLLHAGGALLLYLWLAAATGRTWPSLAVAFLFALHPLHVESVAWIAERKDVLSGVFWMLALWAYLGYLRRPGAARYLLLVAVFGAGLLAKPMLVTLPLILLLLDWWPLGRFGTPAGGQARGRLLLEKGALLIMSAGSSAMTVVAQQRGGAIGPWERLPLTVRAANAVASYGRYLVKTVWPAKLSVIYPYPVHAWGEILSWRAAAWGIALAVLTAAVIAARRSHPYMLTGWLWYLGTLVPVIGVVQVGNQTMADRYTYLPLVGIFLGAAWACAGLGRRSPAGVGILSLSTVSILVLLAFLARRQVGFWKDSLTLFRRAVSVVEDNWPAHRMLAQSLFEQGRLEEAAAEYRETLRIFPGLPDAENNLGTILAGLERHEEAISHFRRAVHGRPDYGLAYYNLGTSLFALGRPEEAAESFHMAIRFWPNDPRPRNNLGVIRFNQGRFREAADSYEEALRLDPSYLDARYNLGLALERLGRTKEAARLFRDTLLANPRHQGAALALRRRSPQPLQADED